MPIAQSGLVPPSQIEPPDDRPVARNGNNERLPEILFFEHPSGLKSVTSVEHLPDPVQMQPKWVPQMALCRQPTGERFEFAPKT
jgi:hypothetical protein